MEPSTDISFFLDLAHAVKTLPPEGSGTNVKPSTKNLSEMTEATKNTVPRRSKEAAVSAIFRIVGGRNVKSVAELNNKDKGELQVLYIKRAERETDR